MKLTHGLKVLLVAALGVMAMLALPAIAGAKDRNNDRIPDRWEKRHHLSLHQNQARRDQDRDHLRNRAEFMAETNPRDSDTDNDGIEDGDENAGTIQSFNEGTGELTIALFGGGTVAGLVTEETEIECDDHSGATASDEGEGTTSDHEEEADDDGDHSGEEADDDGDHSGEEADDDGDHSGEEADDDGEHGDGEHGNCTAADLEEGTVVKEAELHIANGQAVFEKIELGK